MGKEKIFIRHENRKDLVGEHLFGDLAQIIFLVIFLVVWITDSFFVYYATQFSEYAPLYIRIPLAIVILIIAGYLAKKGLIKCCLCGGEGKTDSDSKWCFSCCTTPDLSRSYSVLSFVVSSLFLGSCRIGLGSHNPVLYISL